MEPGQSVQQWGCVDEEEKRKKKKTRGGRFFCRASRLGAKIGPGGAASDPWRGLTVIGANHRRRISAAAGSLGQPRSGQERFHSRECSSRFRFLG